MRLFRIEVDLKTGERIVIDQSLYQGLDDSFLVLDAAEIPPEGFKRIKELPLGNEGEQR